MTLSSKMRGSQSVIDDFFQAGSLKCLFPRPRSSALEVVLLNTAGGVTGGDEMRCDLQAGANTTVTVTTQACERIYRAQPGQTGAIRNALRISAGGHVNWLPQETILFDGSDLDRRLNVDLEQGASVLLVEPVVFGRKAMEERLLDAGFADRIEIRRLGHPIYLERVRMRGDISDHLDQTFVANGANAIASLVFIHPQAVTKLDPLRRLLPETGGASLLDDGVLVCRILATDSYELRKCLLPILRLLTDTDVPRCWMI